MDALLSACDAPVTDDLEQLNEVKAATLRQLSKALDDCPDWARAALVKDRFMRGVYLLRRDADTFRNLRCGVCPWRESLATAATRKRIRGEIVLMMTAVHMLQTADPKESVPRQPDSARAASRTKRPF